MAKPQRLTQETIEYARQQVQVARGAEPLRQALAVLLPAELGITQARAADVLGIGVATVKRYQARLYHQACGEPPSAGARGGRHNETIPLELETAFLADWTVHAERGEVVLVHQLRQDLQRRVGQRIPLYTVYRILARHGWRKVAPDTKHPQGDPAAQEAFKKTSAPCWRPPDARTERDGRCG
ncbi:MAG: winged helix-turn-helix domain-containing protein [Candidatus Sumerlaeota bacterium]|nr:winged helix-turn-helix domain-containing protein [Candidatus Sumerlaeota bacterium]